MRQDYIWLKGNQLLGKLRRLLTGRREANLNTEIAALRPAKFLHFIFEYRKALSCLGVIFSKAHQDRDVPDPLGLLSAGSERPCKGRAPDKPDELAPLHTTPLGLNERASYRQNQVRQSRRSLSVHPLRQVTSQSDKIRCCVDWLNPPPTADIALLKYVVS